METIELMRLLAALVLLVVGLYLTERLTRPPTVAEQMERFRQNIVTLQLVLVDQMTPVLQRATAAMEEFATAWNRNDS